MLRAPIVPDPDAVPAADALRLDLETFVSLDLGDLSGRKPFDIALVLNHTSGVPQATAVAGEYACLIDLGDVDTWVEKIVDRLSTVAYSDEDYATLDAPRVSPQLARACIDVVQELRARHPERYAALADEVELHLHEELPAIRPEDPGKVGTFRVEEARVLAAAVDALADGHRGAPRIGRG